MSTAEEITALKAEIEGYKRDLATATTFEEKKLYGELITTRGQTLNAILASLAPVPSAGIYFSSCWSSNRIVSHHFHVIAECRVG